MTPRLAVLMTLAPLLWAGNVIVGRLVVGHMPPLLLNALRWMLALAILAVLGRRLLLDAGRRAELLGSWRELSLLGLLGAGCYNALQYMALHTSTPINVTLIAASMPLWMLAIGALVYRSRPALRELIGAALSLAGVLVVLSRGQWAQLADVRFVPGDLLMLLAVLAWAFYSWMLAKPSPKLARRGWGWAEFLLAQVLFGVVWASAAAGGEVLLAPQADVRWSIELVAALAYIAIGPSVIAYRCWGLGVAKAGPAVAAFFANLTPLFTALLSAVLLGEPPRGYHAAAFALIVAGIAASARRG